VIGRRHQSGIALFTAVFLIAAVGVLAISVSAISSQQQIATVQSLEQTQAYYAARARLDLEIAEVLNGSGDCGATDGEEAIAGFTTRVDADDDCTKADVEEGSRQYNIYTLRVSASRGDGEVGTLVQRTVRAQVTEAP
jgi:type II secretory pathway component PulK